VRIDLPKPAETSRHTRAAVRSIALLFAVSLGCAAHGASGSNPLAPGSPVADWATPLLGSSDYELVLLRPSVAPDGATDFRSHFPSALDYAFTHCAQADRYEVGGDPDALMVLHDVPAWLDPLRPVPPATSSELYFDSQGPAGTRTYVGHSPFFGAAVVVLPPTTWVVADDRVIVGRLLASAGRGEPLPYPALRPGATAEDFTQHRSGARLARWVPFPEREVGGGVIFFPPRAPDVVPLVIKLVYADAATAGSAVVDLRGLWQSGALRGADGDASPEGFFQRIVGLQTDGATVLVQSLVTANHARQTARDL
jgi:hypothetical protein